MNTTIILLIIAIVSPFIYALINVLDKFVVSHHVRNPLSFAIVAGIVNMFFGLVLALFLNWNGISISSLLFPALVGIGFGIQFFLYYHMLSKEDVSNVIGLIYFYPIIVAILSFSFLNEKLSLVSYIGMALIILGAIMLSVRMNKLKTKIALWMISLLIFTVALNEFFIKIATNHLPALNGLAISLIFLGLAIMLGFFHGKTRRGFARELRNIKWALLIESLTFLATFTVYIAIAGLPVTLVASVAATQPLAVVFLERIFSKYGKKISKDERLLPKLISIGLIVMGIIVMYSQVIFR
jgi:uncharacterized membrane protein